MEGQMTTEHSHEKCYSSLIKQEAFSTICKQEVIIDDIKVEKEELEFSEEEIFDEINVIKARNNEDLPYDWNEPDYSMELKYQSIIPKVESTCREKTTSKYACSTSSDVHVVVTRGGEKLVEVKEEYSDTEVRSEELLNEVNHLLGNITEENILINDIKVENEELELDEANTVDSDVEKEEEMYFDWNEPVTVGPDPLALDPVVQSNIKTECINEGGTGTIIRASSSIQKGNDMANCYQDVTISLTMLAQDKGHRITSSQINLINDCTNFKDVNSGLNEKSCNSKKIYKCSQCSYTTAFSYILKVHMGVHSFVKPFKCLQCNYSCTRSNNLKQHLNIHTGEKPFKCLQCDHTFARSSDLNKHIRGHTDGKPFKCLQCEYSCATSSDLNKHIIVHTSEKPFKCLQCDYCCARLDSLKKHMIFHTGEKPFKCLQCDYSSARSLSDLNKHIRVHTGEKPFKCSQCNHFSARSSHLKQHMRIHTGEKPFKCLQCDYSSAYSNVLKKHMTIHTGKKPFKCLQCNYSSALSTSLKQHTKEVHTGEK